MIKGYVREHWPLLILLIVATAIRLFALMQKGTLWFDELFSVEYAINYPLAETIRYWIYETNPPLYTALMRVYFTFAAPTHTMIVRLPALLFGLGGIVALYHLGAKFFGRAVGLLAAMMLTLSGLHIFMSVEGRVYSLLTLLSILSAHLTLSVIRQEHVNKKQYTQYFAVTLLLLYSHLTAVLMVGINWLLLTLSTVPKHVKRRFTGFTLLAGLLWLVWFIPSIISKWGLRSGSAWFLHTEENLLLMLFGPFIHKGIAPFLLTLIVVGVTAAVCLHVVQLKEREGTSLITGAYVAAWTLIPPLTASALGVFVPKYVLFAYPGMYLLIAMLIVRMVDNRKEYFISALVISGLMLPTLATVLTYRPPDWRAETASYLRTLNAQTTRTYVSFPFATSLANVYEYNVYDIYLLDEDIPRAERVVRYNWSLQHVSDEQITSWVDEQLVYDANTYVFVINSISYQPIIKAFQDRGWEIHEITIFPGIQEITRYTLTYGS